MNYYVHVGIIFMILLATLRLLLWWLADMERRALARERRARRARIERRKRGTKLAEERQWPRVDP